MLDAVYRRTAKKVKEQFAHVPEELRLKKVELNRAETRVHNFIEFIANGRATSGLVDALAQAEEQVKTLKADVASMASASEHTFTPPPRAWIADRVKHLNESLNHPHREVSTCTEAPHRSSDAHTKKAGSGPAILQSQL